MINKNKQNTNQKKKHVIGWGLLVLFQAPPLAQENEERVPTNKAKKQGVKANNKTTKQQLGWPGGNWKWWASTRDGRALTTGQQGAKVRTTRNKAQQQQGANVRTTHNKAQQQQGANVRTTRNKAQQQGANVRTTRNKVQQQEGVITENNKTR